MNVKILFEPAQNLIILTGISGGFFTIENNWMENDWHVYWFLSSSSFYYSWKIINIWKYFTFCFFIKWLNRIYAGGKMLGEVAKFGGDWPGANGIAKTWNVPKYNVDFWRAAAAAIGELAVVIAAGSSVGKASSPGLDASFTGKLLKSSANTPPRIISPKMKQNTPKSCHFMLNVLVQVKLADWLTLFAIFPGHISIFIHVQLVPVWLITKSNELDISIQTLAIARKVLKNNCYWQIASLVRAAIVCVQVLNLYYLFDRCVFEYKHNNITSTGIDHKINYSDAMCGMVFCSRVTSVVVDSIVAFGFGFTRDTKAVFHIWFIFIPMNMGIFHCQIVYLFDFQ